jgi:predicted GNAT superfamily acetyltransferase
MIRIQYEAWGYSEADVVPTHMFVVAAESGGQVLGAFLEDRLVGFTLAYAGEKYGKPYLHSHLAGVLPEYRDSGVGRELKLFQRQLALERGIERIEWTFDPLQSRNAYFNICKLGAICRHYMPDLYGTTSSPLHGNLPTDRLLAEWHLNSERVDEILSGRTPDWHSLPEVIEIPLNVPQLSALAVSRDRFGELFNRSYAVKWFERRTDSGVYFLGN